MKLTISNVSKSFKKSIALQTFLLSCSLGFMGYLDQTELEKQAL